MSTWPFSTAASLFLPAFYLNQQVWEVSLLWLVLCSVECCVPQHLYDGGPTQRVNKCLEIDWLYVVGWSSFPHSTLPVFLLGFFCCCCLFFLFGHIPQHGGILDPQPGIEPAPFTLEAWNSNHWTTREVPGGQIFTWIFLKYSLASIGTWLFLI